MMEQRNIMPEHQKRFDDVMYSSKHTGFILKIFWIIKKTLVIPLLLFEKWLYITNHLIFTNQSGFKTGDSCISHVLSITHGINKSFDQEHTFKVCFLTYQKHLIKFGMKVLPLS